MRWREHIYAIGDRDDAMVLITLYAYEAVMSEL